MIRISKSWLSFPAAALVALLAGCSSKPKATTAAEKAPPPAPPQATEVKPSPAPAPVASTAEEGLPRDLNELNRRGYLKDVFFDFDKYNIRTDQKPEANQDGSWLDKWANVKILIEGHCDERGTAAYNMALGEKRASTVREYLETLGVKPDRIQIISYGKERPFAQGHDEEAWAQNRRDHFVITAD